MALRSSLLRRQCTPTVEARLVVYRVWESTLAVVAETLRGHTVSPLSLEFDYERDKQGERERGGFDN